jgi:transcriptional regulator with XRE-family HTH domain
MTMAELRRQVTMTRELPPPERRRRIRERAGVSRRTVAAAVGVTPSALAFYEAGKRTPRGERLAKYLEALAILEDAAP